MPSLLAATFSTTGDESSGFIASNGKAGRKKKPTPTEALRERVEGEIDKWIVPFEEGLSAERALVVGTGPEAHIETVPDIPTRMKAAESVLDRLYGRAKRQVDVADVTHQRLAEMSEEEITAKLLEIDPAFAEVLELEEGDGA
jgi:hypothetical protein